MAEPNDPKPATQPPVAPADPALKARELELARKKLDADIADQDKRLAETNKAIRAAATPATTTTPLEGKITLDDKAPIQSEVLAQRALESIASAIAEKLDQLGDAQFIVHRDADTAALVAIRVLRAQLAAVKAAYDALIKDADILRVPDESIDLESFVPEVAAATAAVKTVLDLVALFRSDVDIRNFEFTVDEAVLVSMVAARVGAGIRVYYPALYPPALTQAGGQSAQELLTLFGDLRDARTTATAAVNRVQGDRKAALESRLSALTTQHTAFEQTLFSSPAAGGGPPINGIFQAAALQSLLDRGARLLYLKVQKARGSVRTRRWLWMHDVTYGGGAIVTVVVFAADGTIELSDTLSATKGMIPVDSKTADADLKPLFAARKSRHDRPAAARPAAADHQT
jgi:hypothetical protein